MALLGASLLNDEPALHTQRLTFALAAASPFPVNAETNYMHLIISLDQMPTFRPITLAKRTKYFHWTNLSPVTIQVIVI